MLPRRNAIQFHLWASDSDDDPNDLCDLDSSIEAAHAGELPRDHADDKDEEVQDPMEISSAREADARAWRSRVFLLVS